MQKTHKIKNKILLLSHKFNPVVGGIETMSEEFANYFYSIGYDIHILTWTSEQSGQKFPYKIIRKPNIFNILKEYIWADIIFENNINLQLAWPMIFLNKLHLIVVHGPLYKNQGIKYKLKNQWFKHANKVIAVSESLKNKTFPQAEVIHNFYRDNLFKQNINANRNNHNFVFLGRIVEENGVDIAIQTIAKLKNKNPYFADVKLTIVGNGPLIKEMELLSYTLNLRDSIIFKGILKGKELVDELNRHAYILVPSSLEPFGLVAIEAMACGCLPIVSNVDGLPEAVGNAGYIVKEHSVNAFYNAIVDLHNNQDMEFIIRKNACDHLKKHVRSHICEKYKIVVEAIITT